MPAFAVDLNCPYGLLGPGPVPAGGHTVEAVPLVRQHLPTETLKELSKNYSRTFGMGKLLKPEDYFDRARAFAEEVLDSHSIVQRLPMPHGQFRYLKVNVSTGEFLLSDSRGQLILYTRFPVGERGLGQFKTVSEVFERLASNNQTGPHRRIPVLTIGESLPVTGFFHENRVAQHFEKHVLGVGHGKSLEDVLRTRDLGGEFRAEAGEVHADLSKAPENREAILTEHAARYEQAAKDFAASTDPRLITITVERPAPLKPGEMHLISFRFDPVTSRLLIVNRSKQRIVTFHKVIPSHPLAQAYLKKHSLPPTLTPFEYFLATATLKPQKD